MDNNELLLKLLQEVSEIKATLNSDIKNMSGNINKIEQNIDQLFSKVNALTPIETRITNLERRIDEQEKVTQFTVKTLVGIVISAVGAVALTVFNFMIK